MTIYETQTVKVSPKAGKSATALEYERLVLNPPYKGMDAASLWDEAMRRTAK
jgi:hypothetical protein